MAENIRQTQTAPFVYVRQHWGLSWAFVEYLYCDFCTWSSSPSIGQARFSFRYAEKILRPDSVEFQEFNQVDYSHYFVKVVTADQREWYGIILEDFRQIDGNQGTPAGHQSLVAFALEYLLDRTPISSSIVAKNDGAGEWRVNRAIGFNTGSGDDITESADGNKEINADTLETVLSDRGTALFQSLESTGGEWDAQEIAEYLLAYHAPTDDNGTIFMPWEVDFESQGMGWLTPQLKVQNLTVFEVFNRLFSRHRLCGWRVEVIDDVATVKVFTFNHTPIVVPSIYVIQANPNQVSLQLDNLKFDERPDQQQTVVHKSASAVFDVVCARGERRGSVMTLGWGENTLESDWDTSLQTEYDAGAEATGDRSIKQERNRAYRASDKFRRVYRYLRLPNDWDGMIGLTAASPSLDPADAPNTPEPFWLPGLRFSHRLPLKKDHDYSGTKIADNEVGVNVPEGSKAEYLEPIALMKTATSRYRHADRLSATSQSESYGADEEGYWFSCDFRMQDDSPGIILDVHGEQQHVVGGTTFTPSDADDTADLAPVLSIFESLFTVYCQFDSHCEAEWPEKPRNLLDTNGAELQILKRLIIDVLNCRLDYVVPGTVVGIDAAGALVTTTSAGYVRDDREKLLDIASIAYEWYSTPRQALTFTRRALETDLEVGYLITTIGESQTEETINSVVTAISMDFNSGMTTVECQYAELDPTSL